MYVFHRSCTSTRIVKWIISQLSDTEYIEKFSKISSIKNCKIAKRKKKKTLIRFMDPGKKCKVSINYTMDGMLVKGLRHSSSNWRLVDEVTCRSTTCVATRSSRDRHKRFSPSQLFLSIHTNDGETLNQNTVYTMHASWVGNAFSRDAFSFSISWRWWPGSLELALVSRFELDVLFVAWCSDRIGREAEILPRSLCYDCQFGKIDSCVYRRESFIEDL